jgi:hypothetical protein
MGCDISLGRTEPCKDVVGGIKNIYFINFEDVSAVNYLDTAGNTDVIDTLTAAAGVTPLNAYKYELKGANGLEQTITSSREAGTTFVEQTLTAVLKKQDVATHKEVKFLSYGRPRVIVEDYNANFFMMGVDNGAEVTTAAITTGVAMGDLSGYTITMVGMEKIPAPFIDKTADTLGDLGVTVVPGVAS